MTTSTGREAIIESGVESRVLREGYGPGAWHGPDLKGALADVSSAVAFWRPAAGRHNIAEIALHHAYTTRAVRTQITGSRLNPSSSQAKTGSMSATSSSSLGPTFAPRSRPSSSVSSR